MMGSPSHPETSQELAQSSSNSLLSPAARVSAARVARGLFRLVTLLFAARILGPAVYGTYGLLLTLNETLMILSGSGFLEYTTRETAKRPEVALARARQSTELRFAYVAGLVAVGWAVLRLLGYPQQVLVPSLVFSVCIFPRALLDTTKGLLRGAQRFTRVLWVELVEGVALLLFAVVLLSRGGGLWSIIIAELLSAFLGAAFSFVMIGGLFTNQTSAPAHWKETFRKTIAFNIYGVIVDIYDRVDVILLSKLAGSVAVGIYMTPYRMLPMLQVIPYGLMSVVMVRIVGSTEREKDSQTSARVLGMLFAIALFFILEATTLARFGVLWLLGETYIQSAIVLKILVWALVPMFLNHAYNTLLLAHHRERWFIWTASVCMVVNIGANLVFIPRYSYVAAAFITILTELVLLAQNFVLIKKTIGHIPVPGHLFESALMFAILWPVAVYGAHWFPSPLVALLVGIVFCGGMYPRFVRESAQSIE